MLHSADAEVESMVGRAGHWRAAIHTPKNARRAETCLVRRLVRSQATQQTFAVVAHCATTVFAAPAL